MSRATTALICACLCLSSCFGSCERKLTSTVDVPLRLKDLRRKYAAPEFTVDVVRREDSSGGPACAHSPACVVLLPLVLFELATMDRWDDVTVKRGKDTVLGAMFDTDGRLRSAVLFEAAGRRNVVRMNLPALGEDFVVERSRTQTAPDGGDITVATPIQPQVDLLAKYAAQLDKHGRDQYWRGKLLAEAYLSLPGEADRFVLDRLAAADLAEAGREAAMIACERAPQDPRLDAYVRAGALARPSPRAAFEALQCRGLSPDTALAVARAALPFTCSTSHEYDLRLTIDRIAGRFEHASAEVTRGLGACPTERVTVLRFALGDAITDAEAVAALAAPFTRKTLQRRLKGDDRTHRRWLIGALAQAADDDLLEPLKDATTELDAAECAGLVRALRAQSAHKEGLPTAARMLDFVAQHRTASVDEALADIRARDLADAAALALAAAGDDAGRRRAARKLARGQDVRLFARFVSNERELAAYALTAGGCDRGRLEKALARAPSAALEACRAPAPTPLP